MKKGFIKTGTFERIEFRSYEQVKRYRNDLDIFGPKGRLFLYSVKEMKENDYDIPGGWDKSDYGLYYEDYCSSGYFDFRAVETLDLEEIWALKEIKA